MRWAEMEIFAKRGDEHDLHVTIKVVWILFEVPGFSLPRKMRGTICQSK